MKTARLSFVIIGLATTLQAATFTVTTTAPSGPGSLQQAIIDANASGGLDTIAFNIAGGGVHTIIPTNALATIDDPVIIDGYTQPGSSSNSLAVADNAVLLVQLTTTNDVPGIVLTVGGCTIRGLVLNGFPVAIFIQSVSPSNVVEGCFIGTNPTGVTNGVPANSVGIYCDSAFNRVGGTQPWQRNVISGNNDTGINIAQGSTATDNVVQGNFIGTDAQGLSAIPNGQGIRLYSHHNVVGGTTAAARNVISGNTGDAIDLLTGNSNTVQGCYLGIDVTGSATLANGGGLRMQAASYNIIGGSAPGAGNTIGGNDDFGVAILGGSFNQIDGNFVGTDSTGTNDFGNAVEGFTMGGALGASNTIGSVAANLIAFNGQRGLHCGSGVDFTTIEGNRIYSNGTQGVNVESDHYRITGNSIFNNGLLGIDLIDFGPGHDVNDPCDTDTNAGNELQNYPILATSTSTVNSVTIAGFLPSAPSTVFTLEFFANTVCDPSGFGEGETFLGMTNVMTGANCTNNFTDTFPVGVANGKFITATATDPFGNTSEFSACITNFSTAATNCVPAPAGLVGWWPGDGNADDIVGGNNGALQGSATFTAGMVGQAFSLNGTNAFVEAPSSSASDPTTTGSQDAWVYFHQLPSAAGHIMEIIGKGSSGRDFDLQANTDNKFHFFIAAGTQAASTTIVQTGLWYHVAGTWDSTVGLKMYVNGNLEGSNSTLVTRLASGQPLQIGNQPSFGPRLFNGLIDEVEVFDRALSAAEIQSLFNAGSFGKCKNISTNVTPQITCPANIVTNTAVGICARSVAFVATATGTPTPTISYKTNGLAVTSPTTFPKGVTTVSATASNIAGTDQCAFTVTVNDNVKPVITCSGNITTNVAAGVSNAVVFFQSPTIDENCAALAFSGCTANSGDTFPLGTTPVTCTAVDAAANTNTCTFNVTVQAAAPCTITCSTDIVTNAALGACGATVTFNVGSSGSCPAIVATPASGTFFNKGTNAVTVTTNGVTACTFNVTVIDNEPPSLSCPANIITNVPVGVTNAIVNFNLTSADDNCSGGSLLINPPSGTTFPLGTNTVTVSMSDASGNTNGCSFNVIVFEAPPEAHDLALIKMKAPKNINLKGAEPSLTKFVKVTLQNRSPHDEVITNFTGLVTLVAESLGTNCPNATVVVHPGPPNNPKTLKPKQKMTVTFDVTWTCANDPAKGAGHEDFRYLAAVHHEAIDGNPDTHPEDDGCPRAALPGGTDPNPDPGKPLKDTGCAGGVDVKTDVFLKP